MGGIEVFEIESRATAAEHGTAAEEAEEFEIEDVTPARITFLDYLRSPIIELQIGYGENAVTLSARQALLVHKSVLRRGLRKFL